MEDLGRTQTFPYFSHSSIHRFCLDFFLFISQAHSIWQPNSARAKLCCLWTCQRHFGRKKTQPVSWRMSCTNRTWIPQRCWHIFDFDWLWRNVRNNKVKPVTSQPEECSSAMEQMAREVYFYISLSPPTKKKNVLLINLAPRDFLRETFLVRAITGLSMLQINNSLEEECSSRKKVKHLLLFKFASVPLEPFFLHLC